MTGGVILTQTNPRIVLGNDPGAVIVRSPAPARLVLAAPLPVSAEGRIAPLGGNDGQVIARSNNTLIWADAAPIDPLINVTQTMTLTTEWQATAIDGNDIADGTYMLQVRALGETASAVLAWNDDASSATGAEELPLTRATMSMNSIYLRVLRTAGQPRVLQIAADANAASGSVEFRLRKLI